MSYLALYRKYRPKSLDQVLGQPNIVKILKNIIENSQIGHAYLFAGPRGTGKTSVAKIFATSINGVNIDEVNKFVDIVEIDAASNNGVVEVRDIISKSNFSTSQLKYKVYIIDEVHMLSKGAFNAFLKTLEEPPQNVVFVFATTEPEKIPLTVLSRLQRLNFYRISSPLIVEQLESVLAKENIEYEINAIRIISQLAKGSLRDALTLLDQCIVFAEGRINAKLVNEIFGLASNQNLIDIINLCKASNIVELLETSENLIHAGVDVNLLVTSLITCLKDFIVYERTNNPKFLTQMEIQDIEAIRISISDAYDFLEDFVELSAKLLHSIDERQDLELTILKICNKPANLEVKKMEPHIEKPQSLVEEIEAINDEKTNGAGKVVKEVLESELDEAKPIPIVSNVAEKTEFQDEIKNIIAKADNVIDKVKDTVEITLDNTQVMKQVNIEEEFSPEVFPATEAIVGDTQDSIGEPSSNLLQLATLAIMDIINLIIQGELEDRIRIKEKLAQAQTYVDDLKYSRYANWFSKAKSVTAGSNFILLSHQQEEIAELINQNRNEPEFLEFVKEVFGELRYVFVMVNKKFTEVERTYLDLKKTNTLPTPKLVPMPKLVVQNSDNTAEKSDNDRKIESIFGDMVVDEDD